MIPKFRAWDTVDKKIKEVVTINFDTIRNWDVALSTKQGLPFFKMFEEVELMQSTGLFDKNGVEIFEGDILELVLYGERIVADVKHGEYEFSADGEYECERYGWYINKTTCSYVKNTGLCLNYFKNNCIVIGNIYGNPELLEEVD